MSTEVTYDDRLRMVPVDSERYAAAVEQMKADLERLGGAAEPSAVFKLLRAIGSGLVVLRACGEAVSYLERALAVAGDDPGRRTAVLINLADAHRYADDFDRAEPLNLEALDLAPARLRDFALQHLAKLRIDQKRFREAELLLLEALERRRAKGDAELISSTELTLRRCRRESAMRGLPARSSETFTGNPPPTGAGWRTSPTGSTGSAGRASGAGHAVRRGRE
ncbi:tetratricopeptide repeat protein [Nonomuraea terrae]|uniref:tetratricopeptide repeat protein n=1 Tax=Nonomuraea terrae TaxID=2530383 RepID=UPI0037907052